MFGRVYSSLHTLVSFRPNLTEAEMLLPLNQVQAAGCLYDAAHLAGLQSTGGLFKFLLHVAVAKVAQISSLAGRRAVGLGKGKLAEGGGTRFDVFLMSLDNLEGVVLRSGNVGLRMTS